MRNILKLGLAFIFSFNITAATVESTWNDQYRKELSLYCAEDDILCQDVCNDTLVCKIPEETCHNCIGTSITLTYIFNYMGKAYLNTGVEALNGDVVELLKSGEFVTFSSRSIYNHVDNFNSMTLRSNFRKLCSDGTRYPVVMFNRSQENQSVSDVRFVFCDAGVYEMEFSNDLLINYDQSLEESLY